MEPQPQGCGFFCGETGLDVDFSILGADSAFRLVEFR
jgi:hypothetical protein